MNLRERLAAAKDKMPLHTDERAAIWEAMELLTKLQAFKDFVHKRLDDERVPVDPPGEHRDAGCRIGQRLDWVFERLPAPCATGSSSPAFQDMADKANRVGKYGRCAQCGGIKGTTMLLCADCAATSSGDDTAKPCVIGHGHVFKRTDGYLARCGGAATCIECAADAMRKAEGLGPIAGTRS